MLSVACPSLLSKPHSRSRAGEARTTSTGRCTHRKGQFAVPRSVSVSASQLSSKKRTESLFAAASRRGHAGATGRTQLQCDSAVVIDTGIPLIVFTPLIASVAFGAILGVNSVVRILTSRTTKKTKTTATTRWPDQEAVLRENDIRSLTAFEAKSLIANKNYLLIDVRKPEEFKKRHPRGAINVPLFTTLKVKSTTDAVKAGLLGALSVPVTNENPYFVEMVRMAMKEDTAGIIMVDQNELGTMNRSIANNRATQCRALVGIYSLLVDAPEITVPLAHCEGGVDMLYAEGFPSEPRPGV